MWLDCESDNRDWPDPRVAILAPLQTNEEHIPTQLLLVNQQKQTRYYIQKTHNPVPPALKKLAMEPDLSLKFDALNGVTKKTL